MPQNYYSVGPGAELGKQGPAHSHLRNYFWFQEVDGNKQLRYVSAFYSLEKERRHDLGSRILATHVNLLPSFPTPVFLLSVCPIQLFSGRNLGSGHQSWLGGSETSPFEVQAQRPGSQEWEDGPWDKHSMNTGILG